MKDRNIVSILIAMYLCVAILANVWQHNPAYWLWKALL